MSSTNRSVVVTGVGPVSPIGVGSDAFWQGLLSGRHVAAPRQLRVDVARIETLPVVSMPPPQQVPGLDKHLAFLAEQDCAGHRDLAYGLLAVELALADARLPSPTPRDTIGVIQAFEAPGVENTVSRLFGMMSAPPPSGAPPAVYDHLAPSFYAMQPFLYVHLMGKAFGFHGFSTSLHNACASGAFALEMAAQRIRLGDSDVMIVAGGEAFETGVRLEWFRRLELYAKVSADMRPFDPTSQGFYVGEGGGAIVLESGEHAARRGAKVYAEYLGGAFAHQGWKQVIPDVRSGWLREVIRQAMKTAGVTPDQIGLVVPHGAGTGLSDGYEASCLSEALGAGCNALATVFKPATGHLLAASALVETIAALLAIRHRTVPATLHAAAERCSLPIPLATRVHSRDPGAVLKLSTGFTGHDAALLFRPV